MNLQVCAREAPVFSLQSGAVGLGVQVAAAAVAIEPNGTQIPLFKISAVSSSVAWSKNTAYIQYNLTFVLSRCFDLVSV